ncbi:DUF4249 domain-containing protein [Adhaeribacter radiodurans]|uniref:DUF4249 domain-containing protein n=1 Tax=Adhaeribacter radiodurans TaxID=2745197 RepID=A0A7L7LB77_9BACT|nr:DUF4249 domain-containing protein [Adhaeribacter radiodurans]QMU30081.1 DUF4249 domain-containing protein [Adhaeribacter radiodurans]
MSLLLRYLQAFYFFALLLFLSSCVDPFDPKVKDIPESFMVVDGFINTQGVTTIKLSRTINLTADTIPPAERGARVYLEEEAGTQFILREQEAGTYTSDNLNLDPLKKYRLHFSAGGKEYTSDFVSVKTTPLINEVTWQAKDEGMQIYVNSQDAANDTKYYRWKYEETWEFNSAYFAALEYRDNGVKARNSNENIYVCWRSENSSAIKIGTTARLNEDVISNYPLVLVPQGSVKLGRRYSILVKQYALSQEEYAYYEALRKNTENIGSLFDPLPTQLTGNIHCVTNASEPVIGFIGAHSETQKRIFVDKEELPKTWGRFATGYEDCPPLDSIIIDYQQYHNIEDVEAYFAPGIYIPITPIYPKAGIPRLIGFTSSSISCVDCRLRGTNVKPDFWK